MANKAGFFVGTLFGAAVGAVAGLMLAPRSGSESRSMAADAMNNAWDSAVDTYERGSQAVSERMSDFRPGSSIGSDDLRAKVDAARERMDQLRDSLSEVVASTSAQVQDAVDAVSASVAAMADDANATEAEAVKVEVVDEDAE